MNRHTTQRSSDKQARSGITAGRDIVAAIVTHHDLCHRGLSVHDTSAETAVMPEAAAEASEESGEAAEAAGEAEESAEAPEGGESTEEAASA